MPAAVATTMLTLLSAGAPYAGSPPVSLLPGTDPMRLRYAGAPPGTVGNGRGVVNVAPDHFEFFVGGDASGRFAPHGAPVDSSAVTSEFFPGGVRYARSGRQADPAPVEVLHGALERTPYVVALRWRDDAPADAGVEVRLRGEPALRLAAGTREAFGAPADSLELLRPVRVGRHRVVILYAGEARPPADWDALGAAMEAPYRGGLRLHSPVARLDRAVAFNAFLLDLGFDGQLHVCDLYRWRDIWSRDLGSGLVPGALRSGRFAAARTTLERDLERHRTWDPRGLRVSEDASKGGSVEGVSWLSRAVELEYLMDGDRARFERAVETLRPWVDAWIDRDADGSGLVVDVTEWMDHSRFFLFPHGARVLYSNVLRAELLARYARFEDALGNAGAAARLRGLHEQSAGAINAVLWDDTLGAYANLAWGGRIDRRVGSGENALAVLSGIASPERAAKALATVRAINHWPTGSTSISPKMTHVAEWIDHNERVWPWWNAVEARARFARGDSVEAVRLLECCAATLEDPARPGLMKELLSPAGLNEGGIAFLTAAGSFQDAIVSGLLGFEVLEPGCRRLRVAPHAPGWRDWSAVVPLPEGELEVVVRRGRLSLRVTDPRVLQIEAPRGASVRGAAWAPIAPGLAPGAATPVTALTALTRTARRAAVFAQPGLPAEPVAGFEPGRARRVDAEGLLALDPNQVPALIVPGNALPWHAPSGGDVREALGRYLDGGGALVFVGATMHDLGTMGEHGGVVDWYDLRPHLRLSPLGPWRFRISDEPTSVPRDRERGHREGWHAPDADESAWTPIAVPGWWEDHLHRAYDGYGWYRSRFALPASARGETLALDLGRIDDDDVTYVNGVVTGAAQGWQTRRLYMLEPGSAAYAALRFGGENIVAIQVADFGGGGGLHADSTRFGRVTRELAWQPLDGRTGVVSARSVRHAVVSWGPGPRFFDGWEARRGAFGFAIGGRGVAFPEAGPLAGLALATTEPLPVGEAFTDFAASRPWRFEPLAFTETHRGWLLPARGERYACAARVVNERTGGEIVLLPRSLTAAGLGPSLLARLGVTPLP